MSRQDAAPTDRRLDHQPRSRAGDAAPPLRLDLRRRRAPARREKARRAAHVREARSGDRRPPGGRGPRRRVGEPRGAGRRRRPAGVADLADLHRRRGTPRTLRARRRPLPARSRSVALREADSHDRARGQRAALSRRTFGRVRERQRPLRAGTRVARRAASHDRRLRHRSERRSLLRLLGGDFSPRRRRVLVVRRLAGDRIPAERRIQGRRRDVHELQARRPRGHHPALPSRRPAESGGPPRRRRPAKRPDRLDGGAGAGIRIRHRRHVAARQPRGRRPDDGSGPDAPRRAASGPGGRDATFAHGSGPGVGQPEGDRIRARLGRRAHLLGARRLDAPLSLRRRRNAAQCRHARVVVGARPQGFLRRAHGLRLRRCRGGMGLFHGVGEVADRAASLPCAARRLGHDASLIRARRPPGQLQPEPPLLPRCVLEPRRASVSHAVRRGRGPPDGRRSGEDGHPRALRSSGVRAPDDPGLRRTSAAGANPQSARLRRHGPLPRHPAGVRRDRGAARQGRLGPCGSLRSGAGAARLRRRVDRQPHGHRGEQDDRKPLAESTSGGRAP